MANKITVLSQLRACAEAAKIFTSGLIVKLAETVSEALSELDNTKADKGESITIVIPRSGWKKDESYADYTYLYEISVEGVTAKDRATVIIAPISHAAAIACGLCATNETVAGKIKIWSKSIPQSDIDAEYTIDQGKEN